MCVSLFLFYDLFKVIFFPPHRANQRIEQIAGSSQQKGYKNGATASEIPGTVSSCSSGCYSISIEMRMIGAVFLTKTLHVCCRALTAVQSYNRYSMPVTDFFSF